MAIGESAAPVGVAPDIRGDATAREERAAAARAQLESVALPVGDLNAALLQFRRPFEPAAIKFKVQTVFPKNGEPKGCIIITYIDARLVIERLNAVVGGAWKATPQRVADSPGLLWCELEVLGQARLDLGASTKGMSKDLWSDSLKRAAVQFGIGVSVYALPEIKLFANQPHVERFERWDGKANKQVPSLRLSDSGLVKLRDGYRRWLAETGEPMFGPPLDHGDVVGGAGMDAEAPGEDEEEFVPPPPEPLTDDRAVALQESARQAYAALSQLPGGPRLLPPARFNAWLRGSSHSHEALEKLVEHLLQRCEELTVGESS